MLLNQPFSLRYGSSSGSTPGVSEMQTVTVASGAVGADLLDFPLMISLAHMSEAFWDTVNASGGNIRAYAADGVTLLPHDVTFVDVGRRLGRMFVKKTLLAASDNVVVLKTGAASDVALGVADSNGRNAVWADYAVALVFPQKVNRTGAAVIGSVANFDTNPWLKTGYINTVQNPHQGLTGDGTNFFLIDTNAIWKTDLAFTTVATNADPVGATGIVGVNHLGDGCVVGAELFLPVETYPSGPYTNQHIAVFDTASLTFQRSYDISAQAHELSGLCYDGTFLYATDFVTSTHIHKYTTAGVFVESIPLSTPITKMQGIEYVDGSFLVSSSTGSFPTTSVFKVSLSGERLGTAYVNPHSGDNEGLYFDGTTLFLCDVDGDIISLQHLADKADFGRLHYQNAYVNTPHSFVWSAAVTEYWTDATGNTQHSILSLQKESSGVEANGGFLLWDEGPDNIGIWNSTDGWKYTSPVSAPGAFSTTRHGIAHNGTSERKVFSAGMVGTDVGCAARPAVSTGMDFVLGSSSRSVGANSEAYFQFAWLRAAYMGEAWMLADNNNNANPAGFYTVT